MRHYQANDNGEKEESHMKAPVWMKVSVVVWAFLFLATGCSSASKTSATASPTGSTTASAAPIVLKFGHISYLSGATAAWGIPAMRMLKAVAADINATGFKVKGQTYNWDVITYDSAYDPAKAA